LFVGEIPSDRFVLHQCGNPACVNPAHLYLGTHCQNMADRERHGRTLRGEKHGSARLTAQQVSEIRSRYIKNKFGSVRLGREYGVTPQHIVAIVTGKLWREKQST
jgi:hypothetical protein